MEKRNSLQILTILHWSMALPMIVFAGIAYYINLTDPIGSLDETNQVLLYIPGIVLVAAFPVSTMLFNQSVKTIGRDDELGKKIAKFQTAHILRMALFEAAGLIGAVMTLLTATSYNLITIAIALGMFILYQPNVEKISATLHLDSKEINQLKGES